MSAPSSHVYWYEADRLLHAVWMRASEPVPWIASATDGFLRGLSEMTGILRWTFVEGDDWPRDSAAHEATIESKASRDENDNLLPRSGYDLFLQGAGEDLSIEVMISAGAIHVGRNLPLHRLSVRALPQRGYRPADWFFDDLVDLAVRCWNPILVDVAGSDTVKLWGTRSGWSINPGWRLWLADEIGAVSTVAHGATASRLHDGTLISVPDDWTAQQVVDVVGDTIRINGLTEIPH